MKKLQNKEEAFIPVYDFKTNARVPGQKKRIAPKNIVIIEGILSFYDNVKIDFWVILEISIDLFERVFGGFMNLF